MDEETAQEYEQWIDDQQYYNYYSESEFNNSINLNK